MTRDELAQAIPPAYTRWIGTHLMAYIKYDPVPYTSTVSQGVMW